LYTAVVWVGVFSEHLILAFSVRVKFKVKVKVRVMPLQCLGKMYGNAR
jgi:hypothetical protein